MRPPLRVLPLLVGPLQGTLSQGKMGLSFGKEPSWGTSYHTAGAQRGGQAITPPQGPDTFPLTPLVGFVELKPPETD